MRYINKGIILNVVVLSVFILSAFSISPVRVTQDNHLEPAVVCAVTANLATGVACTPNISSCTGGYNLFNDDRINSLFVGGMSLNDLAVGMRNAGSNLSPKLTGPLEQNEHKICLSNDVKALIPAYQSANKGIDFSYDIEAYFFDTVIKTIPRKCFGQLDTPSQSPKNYAFNQSYNAPWGCCPSNFNFIVTSLDANGDAPDFVNIFSDDGVNHNLMACCPKPSVYWFPTSHDARGAGGKLIPAGCLDADFNVVAAVDEKDLGSTSDVPITSSENPAILGAGLNAGSFTIGALDGSDKICSSGSACAIDESGKIIKASDLNTKSGLKCSKCFSSGEAIKLTADGKALVRCSPESTDASGQPVDEVGLCNSSASDTLACLSGGKSNLKNPDGTESNYSLCCKCRTAGGVWTGIGCTDTTPLGVITGIIRIVFGVVGGVALIQLIIAGIMYQTGDEAKIKAARESIIKTLTGLAVLVFSILILRVIGINILDILPAGSV